MPTRAVDQFGQVTDAYVASRRDRKAAHRCFGRAFRTTTVTPGEVVTGRAWTYPLVLEELFLPRGTGRTGTPTTGSTPIMAG
jgi:transposase-like protein